MKTGAKDEEMVCWGGDVEAKSAHPLVTPGHASAPFRRTAQAAAAALSGAGGGGRAVGAGREAGDLSTLIALLTEHGIYHGGLSVKVAGQSQVRGSTPTREKGVRAKF